MATLVSSPVFGPQQAVWPQTLTIIQTFDAPVFYTEDFQLVFYGQNTPTVPENVLYGEMVATPVQLTPTSIQYTVQTSPYSKGRLGVKRKVGRLTDLFGNEVDLKIGNDFDIYNVDLGSYWGEVSLVKNGWGTQGLMPAGGICPDEAIPTIQFRSGPVTLPQQPIAADMWDGGPFYLWVNFTWLPDRTAEGIPFVWEPPFFYSYSGFGFPVTSTVNPALPPWRQGGDTVKYNICSSGPTAQGVYSTCGWIEDYSSWRGKVQVWGFGTDLFSGSLPWNMPQIADPTGDLSPSAVDGFPSNVAAQFYCEHNFRYVSN